MNAAPNAGSRFLIGPSLSRLAASAALMCVFLLLSTQSVLAQHNNRSARDLQFRFGNPGARSLGFGGAFLGLADDATAPVANPAGMSSTSKRSVALELSYTENDNEIPFYGGNIAQTNLFEFDFNLQSIEAPQEETEIPFIAVVFPHNKLRWAAFAHKQANLERSYRTQFISICDLTGNPADCNPNTAIRGFFPSTDILRLEIDNVGASFGSTLGENFSWGVSVFYSQLDYQADSFVDFEQEAGVVVVEKLAGGKDEDWGGIVGILWKATPEFTLGATYKRQPDFVYTARLSTQDPLPGVPLDFNKEGAFKIPDSVGIGISFHPVDQMTLNLDVNRVYYSQITDDLIDFAFVENAPEITQTMSDVTEIHAGMEWLFINGPRPIALRAGYWLDPYHAATNSVEDSQLLQNTVMNPEVRDIFFLQQFEEDENHYSLGLGVTFNESFQLDGGIEVSDQSRRGVISGIYRF